MLGFRPRSFQNQHPSRLGGLPFLVLRIALIISPIALSISEQAVWTTSAASTSPTVLRADTFVRANSASGWGTASDGNTWAPLSGAAASGGTVRISSNKGILIQSSASLFNVLGSSVGSADQEGLVRWAVDSTSATAGILLRAQDSANYYLARYSGNNSIQFSKRVGGTSTYTTAMSFTPVAGKLNWMRFQAQGTTFSIKVWADGTPEPAAWNYITTDTSFSAPGYVGLYGYASNSTANTFDSFTITDVPSVSTTSTPEIPTLDVTSTPVLTNTPIPTDTATPVTTDTPAPSSTSTAVKSTILRTDTFVRASTISGWGTASDGSSWNGLSGASPPGGTVGIINNTGVTTQNSSSLFTVLGSSVSSADQEGLVRWSVDSISATAGILLRAQDTSNYYLARYNGAGSIELMKKVGGVSTHYTAFSFSPGGGNLYWMRFQVQGTVIKIKVWAEGSPEPDLWGYTTTDASLSAAGSVGLYSFAVNDASNTFDSFTVSTPGSSGATAASTSTPVPTEVPTPDTGAVAGPAQLTVVQSSAGVTVRSLNPSSDGWQAFFNRNQGGAITSMGEIDGGVYAELMQQAVPHAHVQSYVNVNGTLVSNQQPGAQISVLRNSPALVALRTVSTNPIYGLTWTYYYYIWPGGSIYVQLNVRNSGASALILGGANPLEINHDGLVLANYANQAPYEWYGLKGSITSPVPSSPVAVESDFFARTPSAGSGPTLGSFMDKLTPWSSVGASSYGTRDFSGGTNGRAKEQWFGSMSSLAAGKTLTFSILVNLRRNLTQAQSLDIDADYRSPGITASSGSVNSSDTEPVVTTLVNGFNTVVGTHVLSAQANHINCVLTFPPGVRTRWSPAYKILGWSKGAPTVRWGNEALTAGRDFAYTFGETSKTLYLQLNFDVVAQAPLSGQRLNDYLDVS